MFALRLEIKPSESDRISALLWELGTVGILTEEELPERTRLLACFSGTVGPRRLLANLKPAAARLKLPPGSIIRLERTEVAGRDWLAEWRRSYRSFSIGRSFLIIPSWEKIPPKKRKGRVVIRLDPGMAFGSGMHESTRLCLLALEENYLPSKRVLDIGTGSGILAIAAAKLLVRSGWSRRVSGKTIHAFDNDPQALAVAVDNLRRNRVDHLVHLSPADLQSFRGCGYDLVLANLTAGTIIANAERLARTPARGGTLVLSGILAEQAEEVARRLDLLQGGPRITGRCIMGEWTCLILKVNARGA